MSSQQTKLPLNAHQDLQVLPGGYYVGQKIRITTTQLQDILAGADRAGLDINSLADFDWQTYKGHVTLVMVKNLSGADIDDAGALLVKKASEANPYYVELNATNNGATPYFASRVIGIVMFPLRSNYHGWALYLEDGDVLPLRAGKASITYLDAHVSACSTNATPLDQGGIELTSTSTTYALAERTILGIGLGNSGSGSSSPGDLIPVLIQKG